ncbi:MAG: cobalt ECF transporter T component CbiQ [Desulfobulbus sp.]|uniref:cobalt ECF transporter T component CbiQ n=1 Tax=Desulfobulbus sp. TaxID=895 RepID=UPI00284A61D1|nr:cobalt ECF transporter T component CbiQ [Desulfobulbus sp.]MDR2551164.1 cobalt ECF transporter T component CbiQ [Desulfobulbus sp.]
MSTIESAFIDLQRLDRLAACDSAVHRLDPRVKVLITLAFLVCVVSFDKYAIAGLLPFALFLTLVIGLSGIPSGFVLNRVLLAAPLALLIGLFNPVYDHQPLMRFGTLVIAGGWLSLLSLVLRFCLTVGAVLALIATTGFNAVCRALEQLGMPTVLAVQLLLLYRYLFVLVEEGLRLNRARVLRSFQGRGLGIRACSFLLGSLLLRTLDRSQRIHLAMRCRGFDGTIHTRNPLRLNGRDVLTLTIVLAALLAMRVFDGPMLLGRFVTGLMA